MAVMPPDEANPFRAPVATIGGPILSETGTDAELIRRTYLNHEASVKSLGSLYYLGAIFGAIATVGYGLAAAGLFKIPVQDNGGAEVDPRLIMGVSTLFMLVMTGINGGMGYGLHKLQTWARWVVMVLTGMSLGFVVIALIVMAVASPMVAGIAALVYTIPSLIGIYIFYLMASAKGAMVFSPEYREVVRQTPYIKYKTSILIKIFLGLIIALVVVGVIVGIISNFAGR